MTTVQIYVHETLNLGGQNEDLQGIYPHLRNLTNQSFNLNEIQVILGQDCCDINHPLKFKTSDDKTATWAVKSKIGWALSGPLQAK